jgi:hypothetical protein
MSFDPGSFEPLSHAIILKPVEKDNFMITGSDEIEMAGEEARFELDKNGQAKRVCWGATYADRFTY